MNSRRNSGLDLGRFFAALIVAMGHLLFVQSLINSWADSYEILNIFRLGTLSVLFFFCLSGFVLQPQFDLAKCKPRIWLKSRLVRLLPIYYLTWVFPMIFFMLLASRNGGSIFPNGYKSAFFGLIASQSWTKYYLDLPNPPLWSLSVEIYLSFLFLLFARLQNGTIYIVGVISYVLSVCKPELLNPILASIPYFVAGIVLRNPIIEKFFYRSGNFKFLLFPIIFCVYLGVKKNLVDGENSLQSRALLPFFVGLLLFIFAYFSPINSKFESFAEIVGSRTYSLYAVHFPILIFVVIGPFKNFNFHPIIYIFLVASIILIATEFTYQFVEKPFLNRSRKIRRSISINR